MGATTVVRVLTALLTVVGGVSFGGGLLLALGVDLRIPDSFELPLGHLRGVAVDSRGNVYVGTQFYGRVQVYDADGKYLFGKFIYTSGGAFRIRIDARDQLEVATARNDQLYVFSKDGSLINVLPGNHCFDDFGRTNKTQCRDERDGTTYEARHTLTFPTVVKRKPGERDTALITTPLRRWVFMGPFPAIVWLIAGAGIRLALDRWSQRRRGSQDRPPREENVSDEGIDTTCTRVNIGGLDVGSCYQRHLQIWGWPHGAVY
jgi:hypothetical protein